MESPHTHLLLNYPALLKEGNSSRCMVNDSSLLEEAEAYWRQHERLSDTLYHLSGVCMILIILLAWAGNLTTVIVFITGRQSEFVSNWFLLNMAVADLMAVTLCYPLVAVASFFGYWPFGNFLCQLYAMGVGVFNFATIGSMAMVAVDRCLVIRRCTGKTLLGGGRVGSTLSRKSAQAALCFLWLYSCVLTLPPAFGWGTYVYDAMDVSCTFDYVTNDQVAPYFVLLLFSAGFCAPLCIIIVQYIYIFRRLHTYLHNTGVRVHQGNDIYPTDRLSQKKMAKMGVTTVFCFSLAWLPYGVLALSSAFWRIPVNPVFQCLAGIFAKSSAVYNPIIYSTSHPDFRKKMRRALCKRSTSMCAGFHQNKRRGSGLRGFYQDYPDKDSQQSQTEHLEISMNVSLNVRRTNAASSNQKYPLADMEIKQTMSILNGGPQQPIVLEQVMIHSPYSL